MPFLAAPGGCGDSLVAEIHLFVHLHLILQAGQNELFSSVFLFPAAVLFHQRAGDSLAAVFRQDTEAQQYNVFTLRVVQTDFIEKGITEFCLVCCKSVQRSGDFSGFFVYCRQKQLRRVLHPLAHTLLGARLIRRKARQLNGNALFHFILADGSKFISFHFMVFLHCPLKKLQKTVFHGKLIERGFFLIQIIIIFSGPQIDRQTVERKAFFAHRMGCADHAERSALH